MRFAIVGSGMSGILAAIKLKEAGHTDITVYEKADRIGGTWRDNRYPGLACDVPAHAYTYQFAPNPEWSAYLADGAEIQAYFEKTADDFAIRPLIRFNTEIVAMEWIDDRWRIETANGEIDHANVAIIATGVLHHPKMPDIPGLDGFAGVVMHTARWDTDVDLTGRRIGVIGNGSTGVQLVAHLGLEGHQLVHFQRTPQWIMPFPNRAYTEEEKAAFRASVAAIDAVRYAPEFLHNVDRFANGITDKNSPQIEEIESLCRNYLESSVRDPELREKLRPTYKAACKRLIYSSTYYDAVQRPNVATIVAGVERVVPEGVIDGGGALHELDILALATGFHADRFVRPMSIKGMHGADIEDAWAERCAAYLGISIPKFPNLFFLNGPTSPVGNFSLIDIAERQWAYVEQLIARLRDTNAKGLFIAEDAFATHEKNRVAAHRNTIWASGCTSWYLDKTGVPITWPWTYDRFRQMTAKPDFADFVVL